MQSKRCILIRCRNAIQLYYHSVPDPSRGEGCKEVTSCWSAGAAEERGVCYDKAYAKTSLRRHLGRSKGGARRRHNSSCVERHHTTILLDKPWPFQWKEEMSNAYMKFLYPVFGWDGGALGMTWSPQTDHKVLWVEAGETSLFASLVVNSSEDGFISDTWNGSFLVKWCGGVYVACHNGNQREQEEEKRSD